MKKWFRKNIHIILGIIFVFACILNVLVSTNSIVTVAEENVDSTVYFTGRANGVSRSELHSATKYAQYIDQHPVVTVLTHGLNSNAATCSNNLTEFAYDENSLIEQIRATNPNNIEVYWAGVSSMYYENDTQLKKYNFKFRKQNIDSYNGTHDK
ncbi:MAG: hypothetical protein LBE09_03280, partial [Christensenellaceae bacterium]|nr:hypothetical protein [Christensenellaceae bacterium]